MIDLRKQGILELGGVIARALGFGGDAYFAVRWRLRARRYFGLAFVWHAVDDGASLAQGSLDMCKL